MLPWTPKNIILEVSVQCPKIKGSVCKTHNQLQNKQTGGSKTAESGLVGCYRGGTSNVTETCKCQFHLCAMAPPDLRQYYKKYVYLWVKINLLKSRSNFSQAKFTLVGTGHWMKGMKGLFLHRVLNLCDMVTFSDVEGAQLSYSDSQARWDVNNRRDGVSRLSNSHTAPTNHRFERVPMTILHGHVHACHNIWPFTHCVESISLHMDPL